MSASAADLTEVSGWEIAGLPQDIGMYAYVPDAVVENPPLLVLIHYCGGTAPAVFGQAQGGGIVSAADEHGFIIIAPSSGRCWDIVSDATRTREGLGDSHAIRQMVSFAVQTYGANPDRVYATGNSSGGMMTQLLLGLYPEVFRGGSAMAGMPAGCRGDNESGDGGGYSGACAGGNVDRTPEQWGAVVDSLSPGHTGLRPRVQLLHGDQDNIISFKNHTEAIDEWTYVLGLSEAPDEESMDITLGQHDAIRRTWIGECGLPVLDAFTSLGGDHGPSDALFPAQYVIPFLGLDQPGPVDPYVEACEALMPDGTGGADGAGGTDGSGGALVATGGTGGAPSGTGGVAAGGTGSGGIDGSGAGGTAVPPSTGGATPSDDPPAPTDSNSSSGPSTKGNCSFRPGSKGPYSFGLLVGVALWVQRRRRRALTSRLR